MHVDAADRFLTRLEGVTDPALADRIRAVLAGNDRASELAWKATLPALATECTAYSETTRVPLTTGAVSGGATSNAANIAEFTFPVAKTVYGAFIASAPANAPLA